MKAAAALLFAAAGLFWAGATQAQPLQLVGHLDPFPGNDSYADVWGEGDYAYLGSFAGSGVSIIDISNPNSPFLETTYGTVALTDLKVHDGVGYFASDRGDGLHIVDLSDPTTPSLLSKVTSLEDGFDRIHSVFFSDGFLYETDGRTPTIKVFDVSNPSNPFFVRDLATPDTVLIHDITIIGDRLYASGFGGFTYIYDVADIGSVAPTILGTVPTGIDSHSSWATSDGSVLISAQENVGGDVKIFDISDPGVPVLLATVDATSLGIEATAPHNPVLFSDTVLFISWYEAGVVAIDLTDPANPLLVGNLDTFFDPVVGAFDGNWGVYPLLGLDRVLLSDLDGGLFIVDATATFNNPPVAICQDANVPTDPGVCSADASVDGGSFDSDGDPLMISQEPPGPYPLGMTGVTLVVSDEFGASDSCEAKVTVEDTEAPLVVCNAPRTNTITPPDAPISFTASAMDNCGVASVEITDFDCFKFTKKGKRIDKTESCVVTLAGDTITILDSGGVNDHIEWTVVATDASGNQTVEICEVLIENPGHKHHKGMGDKT